MSQSTVIALFPQVVYNGTNTTVTGDKYPAAGYYLGKNELQTISWKFSVAAVVIKIQATLEQSPEDDDWFTVHTVVGTGIDEIGYENISGNFVWIRAVINNFASGSVQFVRLTY